MSADSPHPRPHSILGRLIFKDLYLYRWLIASTLIAGVASLVLLHFSDGDGVSTGPNIGFLVFLTTVIAFGVSLPMLVLKEHQTKSHLFVLSLPVSPGQYAGAKVAAALLAFLVPWTALTGGVVALTVLTKAPDGGLPFFVALMTFLLGNFCLLMAIAVITLSDIATIAGILVTNISGTVVFFFLVKLPGVAGRSREQDAVWSAEILTFFAIELALILISLGLAFYVPSRKKDSV